MMNYSEVESKRFGMKIFRGLSHLEICPEEIRSELLENKADVAILRFPSSQQVNLHRLDKVGFHYLITDTLFYWSTPLQTKEFPPLKNKTLVFEPAEEKHYPIINKLVSEIFPGYTNHYSANPFLPKSDILEGYSEWARNYCKQGKDGLYAWIIKDNDIPASFSTWDETVDRKECRCILGGVVPSFSGKGIYTDFLIHGLHFFKTRGIELMKVSTQVQNVTVQKAWSRLGLTPLESFITIHINAFLTRDRDN